MFITKYLGKILMIFSAFVIICFLILKNNPPFMCAESYIASTLFDFLQQEAPSTQLHCVLE